MNAHIRRLRIGRALAALLVLILAIFRTAEAAVIGVLSDGRQFAQLSPLYEFSAAKLRLVAAGHSVQPLGAGSLTNAPALASVDILWLPLLEAANAYSQAERAAIAEFAADGGRILWIGEWGFYNAADDSLLSAFGLSKLEGAYNDTLAVSQSGHAVATGPEGAIAAAGTDANYGLIAAGATLSPLFAAPGGGVLVGVLHDGTGWNGAGRVALVCDSHMFESSIETDDHETLLLNLVAWLAQAPGYTPSGAASETGNMPGGCGACVNVSLELTNVAQTGWTGAAALGVGRCGFDGIDDAGLPPQFFGWAIDVHSTAGFASSATAAVTVHYDSNALAAAGISDSGALRLWCYEAAGAILLDAVHDSDAQTITALPTPADSSMIYLLGAQMAGGDCNSNEIPDDCELDAANDCDANGIPDECDVNGGGSADCNSNGVPDVCDVNGTFHSASGALSPIGAGSPQSFVVGAVPLAVGPVTIRVTATADLSTAAEYIEVLLNGTVIGRVFETGGADCPGTPNVADLSMSSETFNNSVAGGPVVFDLVPSPGVNADLCTPASSATIELTFDRASVSEDCNENGIPDECESDADCDGDGTRDLCAIAAGAVPDCNGNGIPDSCDVAGGAADCNGDGVPDECQATVSIDAVAAPPLGGIASISPAVGPYELCGTIGLSAQPAAGYCFSHWSSSAGAQPANPQSASTSAVVDMPKTLTAHFVQIITAQPQSADVCAGDNAAFAVQIASVLEDDAIFSWRLNGAVLGDSSHYGGTATATLSLLNISATHAGEYTCIITHSCGSIETAPAILSVGLPPSVAVHPPAQQFVCPGQPVTFDVTAAGASISYQWQFDGGSGFADLSDTMGVAGTASPSLAITNVSPAHAGRYRCVVSGPCGPDVVSGECDLAVGAPPVITTSPPLSEFVCPGATLTLTVAASGTAPVYQWRFNNGSGWQPLADGGDVVGATGSTLTIENVHAERAGQYQCVISGACQPSATTAACQVSVGAEPLVVASPPPALSRCPGDAAQLSIGATGTTLTYRWEFLPPGAADYQDVVDGPGISGAATPSLVLTNISDPAEGTYRCVVTGACGEPAVGSPSTLTVEALTAISDHPQPVEICAGTPAAFECAAIGSGLSYQWQFNGGAAYQNLVNGNGISGAQSPFLAIDNATPARGGLYRCVVLGQCGAPQISNAALLTVSTGVCDCNANGTPDEDDVISGGSADCNGNGVPDECEIDAGTATDCDGNGTLDVCELQDSDCNGNGKLDRCEIDADSTAPGGPFHCEQGCSADCNSNGIPDVCDLSSGDAVDCNGDNIPDECQPLYIADAGPDIQLCTGQVSASLGGGTVASPAHLNYSYAWSVVSGPGSGPAFGGEFIQGTPSRPLFRATLPGIYVIELTIALLGSPNCTASDQLTVTAYDLQVEAGAGKVLCAGSESQPLAPSVDGGIEPLNWQWSIEPGAPDTSAALFTGTGAESPSPTFSPVLPGTYVLRLTITDGNWPSCVASDTLVVQAVGMTASAPAGFAMGPGATSPPLNVAVTSGGTPPFSYAWFIGSGSPDTSSAQFGGSGPASPAPTFTPSQTGQYRLHCTIADSSNPPCTLTKTIDISVASMTVDAGSDVSICTGAGGIALSPALSGGVPPFTHVWTIEPGAPSTDPVQFVEHGVSTGAWVFVPVSPGAYVLRYTATDSATPPTVRSDTLLVRATYIDVDAGPDMTVQAFVSSPRIGPLPLAVGTGQLSYEWHVVAGPSLDDAQFDDPTRDRPRFTPAAVGDYLLEVSVSDAASPDCAVSDQVVVRAIASSQTLAVNDEGRLFMNLQLADGPTSELRIAEGTPGRLVSGELTEGALPDGRHGLLPSPDIDRRLVITAELDEGTFVALVAMQYLEGEIVPGELDATGLHRWEPALAVWKPAASGSIEAGPFPVRPTAKDVGRRGVNTQQRIVWAIVNVSGEFTLGATDTAAAASETPGLPIPGAGGAICGGGAAASSAAALWVLALWVPVGRHYTRRRRTSPRH